MASVRFGVASLAIAASLLPATAFAQSAAPAEAAPAANDADQKDTPLNEILVVAQKRVERLGDVPVSVGLVQAEQLRGLNLTNFEQMSHYVPAFNVAESASGNRITLRGISSGTNRGFEQSVGMFVDGIYTGRAAQFSSPFFDVERVEVLKGPQSILFGKNTVAGAVSIITARPSKREEISLSGGYETRLGGWDVSGVFNKPLADNLQVRIAYKHEQRDKGFLYNTRTGENEPARLGNIARVSLAWQPGNVEVNAKYEYSFGKRQGGLFQIFAPGPFTGTFTAFDPKFESNLDLKLSNGAPGSDLNTISAHNLALRVNLPLGSANLTSDTGYSTYKTSTTNEDSDFTPVPVLRFDNSEKYHQFSQEFRFASTPEDKLAYTAGLFFQSAHYVGKPWFRVTSGALDSQTRRVFDQHADTYSAFGELSYRLADGLRLIAGGRYMIEDKSADRSLVIYNPVTGVPETSPTVIATMGAVLGARNFSLSQAIKEKQFTPAVTLQYKIAPNTMAYAKFTRGFKSGGFDASDSAGTALPYDSESVSAYEAGLKWGVSRSFNLNLTGFYSKFDNLQVQAFNGISFITTNAAKASSRGVEAEARWSPVRGFTLAGSVVYIDAHYDSYTGAACTTGQTAAWTGIGRCRQDLSGRPLTDAAHWSSSLSANYEFAVASDWSMKLYAGANSRSGAFVAPDLDPLGWQKGYTTADASVELLSPNDRLSISLLAKNIGDVRAKTYVVNVPLFTGAKAASIIDPRTVEVRVGIKF
ncbi:MAG: TonB-dependent receptor [Sphingomonadales bacterium]|nr:TonB-dependent receptor [Sphingomonadales bacterium]